MTNIPYIGEILSVLTAVTWAFAVILLKKSGETVHPVTLNLFKNFLATLLFLPTMWFWGVALLQPFPAWDYGLCLLSGALGIGLADTLFLHALNRLGAGLIAIVDCTYSPFVILLSLLWLGESLTIWQFAGVSVIIIAVLTATKVKAQSGISRRQVVSGITIGTFSLLLMAVGIVIVKPLLDRSPLLWITEVRLIGGCAVLGVVLLFHRQRRTIVKSLSGSKGWKYTLWGSFFGAYLAMILWLGGMKFTQVSVSSALNQTSNVFIFVFAALFLKEQVTTLKVIGILLALTGVFLVMFG